MSEEKPKKKARTISRANPQPALDALIGRVYTFKGKKIRNSNMAMIALAKCGIPLEDVRTRSFEALPIAIFAMTRDVPETLELLSQGADAFRVAAMEYFSTEVSAEEHGEALGIFSECMMRFGESLTRYHSQGASSGNSEAAAGIS